jgi:hypothetical protein
VNDNTAKKQMIKQEIESDEYVISTKPETPEDFPDIPFSKANIACSSGDSKGLYGKFPLKQQWTIISLNQNQIVTTETKRNYYDFLDNLNTSFFEQWEDSVFRFDIAFLGVYPEKDIEILPLTEENDVEIINLIEQNLPDEVEVKDFFRGENIEPEPIEPTDIQLYSFTNNENKFWIAYYKFRLKNYEHVEHTSLIGVTPDNEVVLLSSYCLCKNVCVIRLKNEFLLYVTSDTCGEGAIVTTRLYKLTTNFEKFFEETIIYD